MFCVAPQYLQWKIPIGRQTEGNEKGIKVCHYKKINKTEKKEETKRETKQLQDIQKTIK